MLPAWRMESWKDFNQWLAHDGDINVINTNTSIITVSQNAAVFKTSLLNEDIPNYKLTDCLEPTL